jgi:type IV secretion system protein VirD4
MHAPSTAAGFNNRVGPQLRRGRDPRGNALLVLFLLVVLGSAQMATQLCARDFHDQPALGPRAFGVYPPWGIALWAHAWGAKYPAAFRSAGNAGLLVLTLGVCVLAAGKLAVVRANPYLHGSARWAERNDIERSGLLSFSGLLRKRPLQDGVYVGSFLDRAGRQHYLRHTGPEHVLCYAPTRSGKGVGLVVPTLLSWPHSAFVTDLKGELWALTAGWRKGGAHNRVLRFEPASSGTTSSAATVRWNPLAEIRLGAEHEVADVQNLATLIVDPDGKGLETHWQKTAQALLVGVIVHVLYKAKHEGSPATLAEVDRVLADPSRPVGELWTQMCSYGHLDGVPHPVASSAGRDMLDRPQEEAGSVLSTAKSYLALYRDPVVAQNTSSSDFRLRDLMHAESAVTLYVVTQPTDKDRLRPLVRTLVNMTLRALADRLDFEDGQPKAHYKHRLLLMLDEFTSLKKLAILQESLAFIAGYGIKAYLICQDIEQLKSREGYGRDETITSNCHVQVALPPNRLETAEHLSRMTGQTTVAQEQVTTSGAGGLFANRSRTTQWVQRPLLTADECLRLPGPEKNGQGHITKAGDMLVFVAGFPAIYGQQPLYFADPIFAARATMPAPGRPQ